MDYIEIKAKTVADAITEASVQLGVTSDKLDYEVIDPGKTSFFGLMSKPAIIKARKKEAVKEAAKKSAKETVKEDVAEKKQEYVHETENLQAAASVVPEDKEKEEKPVEPVDAEYVKQVTKDFLADVFRAMELEVEILMEFDDSVNTLDVEFKGPDMGVLIGKRGQTLDSLQYLTNLAVNKKVSSYIKVKLDTENYRKRRKDTLENLAKNIAFKVKRSKRPVSLEPMNPFERRVIHSALQNDRFVATHSEGEEPFRHVVVTLKRNERYDRNRGGRYRGKKENRKENEE